MDFMNLPLFVRENSVLAMSDDAGQPQWKSSDPLGLHLFNIADGADLTVEVPAGDGESVAQFRVRRKGDTINIETDGRAKKVRAVIGSREFPWADSKKTLSIPLEI
jgi:alpha-D-xyloside xylohydrolase